MRRFSYLLTLILVSLVATPALAHISPFGPLVYSGYRRISYPNFTPSHYRFEMDAKSVSPDSASYIGILTRDIYLPEDFEEGDEILELEPLPGDSAEVVVEENWKSMGQVPSWLRDALTSRRIISNLQQLYMAANPKKIDYADWEIPLPPHLPEEDLSFEAMLQEIDLPVIDSDAAVLPEMVVNRRYWLHSFGTGLQFSQAFISSNWYQGGSDYLSLLFNFNWDVALNTVWRPNLLFTSALSYKLAINANSKEVLHRYTISQDQFQYNLKAGLKAREKWFYSITMQFKTQFFHYYPADSPNISAAFLSPSDFNVGLGMTYANTWKDGNLVFSASIAPLSYNLKTCIHPDIDRVQFNIEPGHNTHSEFGSNAEVTLQWAIAKNLSWKSRLFLFTNYKYFLADWENTLNFSFNKFLSTQLYFYPRFDSSSDRNSSKWHYWMMKEILSVGFSYTFGTKP